MFFPQSKHTIYGISTSLTFIRIYWSSRKIWHQSLWYYSNWHRQIRSVKINLVDPTGCMRIEIYLNSIPLQWRHNEGDSITKLRRLDCLLNCLFRRRPKKASKIRITGLCAGNSPGTGEFPAQKASEAENISIWWRHHEPYLHNVPSPRKYKK